MGIHLRPGHKPEKGKRGWEETGYDSFLEEIKIGKIDLGFWGKQVQNSKSNADAHSPIYSIPNPWASAYLFNYVSSDNTHSLSEYLIVQILNVLSELAVYQTLEPFELNEPAADSNSPFKKIWNMAPAFLKYGNVIYLIRDKKSKEIVGGFSKSSLVWTSQKYEGKSNIEFIENDEHLISYLKFIKDLINPTSPEINFDSLWGHPLLARLLNKQGRNDIELKDYAKFESINWLKKITKKTDESDFLDSDSGCMVLDYNSLNKGKNIFKNKMNPIGLIEELKGKKSNSNPKGEFPLGLGQGKWVILDELLEPYWINSRIVEKSDTKFIRGIDKGFLYPVKPEYLRDFQLKIVELKLTGEFYKGTSNAKATINWKSKIDLDVNTNFVDDTRSIAIWPPFQSEYTSCFVIEYHISEIQSLEKLQFFDNKGEEIKSDFKYYEGQNFRVYNLSDKRFPEFIRIQKKYKDESFGGIITIKPKPKGVASGLMTLGIDFGTSHTAVYYSKNDETDKLKFNESSPTVIADSVTGYGVSYNFLPNGLSKEKPNTEEEWNSKIPWQPFITQWMDFSNKTDLKSSYLMGGNIPFFHFINETNRKVHICNELKWGAPENITKYRKLFLQQLLLMSIVEAEAKGFEKLKINWSYPKAFSDPQLSILKGVWATLLSDLKIKTTM